jgi:hypothetical protein
MVKRSDQLRLAQTQVALARENGTCSSMTFYAKQSYGARGPARGNGNVTVNLYRLVAVFKVFRVERGSILDKNIAVQPRG